MAAAVGSMSHDTRELRKSCRPIRQTYPMELPRWILLTPDLPPSLVPAQEIRCMKNDVLPPAVRMHPELAILLQQAECNRETQTAL